MHRRIGQALGVERFRAVAAPAVRIVDDVNTFGKETLAHAVLQETGAARHGRAVHRAGEMTHETVGDAGGVDDRHLLGIDLAGLETGNRAFAGGLADIGGGIQVAGIGGAGGFVIPLHAGAFAGEDRDPEAVTAGAVAAGKPVGRRDGDVGRRPRRLRPFGIGDAEHPARRGFAVARALGERLGGRLLGIGHIQLRDVAREDFRRVGETAMGIVRHRLGHGDRALDQFRQRRRARVGRRGDRLFLAEEDPEADVPALRTFDFLDLAQPLRVAQRDRFEIHRIRRVGAGLQSLPDKIVQHFERIVLLRHRRFPPRDLSAESDVPGTTPAV